MDDEEDEADKPEHMSRLVRAEVVLSTQNVRPQLCELVNDERWTEALPDLLNEFTGLLRDALDLMHELGQADERSDQSYSSQPSISEHPQNHGLSGLDDVDRICPRCLARNLCSITGRGTDRRRGVVANPLSSVPRAWHSLQLLKTRSSPVAKRLTGCCRTRAWWLWTPETLREAMRLLVALAPRLEEAELDLVEQAVLSGPPRVMYRDDMEPEVWARIPGPRHLAAACQTCGERRDA